MSNQGFFDEGVYFYSLRWVLVVFLFENFISEKEKQKHYKK